jgi:hypothetical protein
MARGRKPAQTIEQQIINIQQEINKKQDEISSLKLQLDSLNKEKEQAELQKLNEAIKASGKTVEEVFQIISQTPDDWKKI